MNSKGIQPRAGMQFVFLTNGIRRRISKVTQHGTIVCDGRSDCCGDTACTCTSRCMWDGGGKYEIEWIPPTDEERVMFANAAICIDSIEFDIWFMDESPHLGARSIAESLALDGMDIDDVSKIEELMR